MLRLWQRVFFSWLVHKKRLQNLTSPSSTTKALVKQQANHPLKEKTKKSHQLMKAEDVPSRCTKKPTRWSRWSTYHLVLQGDTILQEKVDDYDVSKCLVRTLLKPHGKKLLRAKKKFQRSDGPWIWTNIRIQRRIFYIRNTIDYTKNRF